MSFVTRIAGFGVWEFFENERKWVIRKDVGNVTSKFKHKREDLGVSGKIKLSIGHRNGRGIVKKVNRKLLWFSQSGERYSTRWVERIF